MVALLDVADAARLLCLSTRAVYELAEAKDPAERLPAVRIGRRLRFRLADLEAYVAERAQ